MGNLLIIKTTSDDKKVLERIAKNLLIKKMCACVNITDKVSSMYIWKNEVKKSKEFIMLIKTNAKNEKFVYDSIKSMHNYEIPEISSLNASNADENYLNWLNNYVK